jgi:hypothetical protein
MSDNKISLFSPLRDIFPQSPYLFTYLFIMCWNAPVSISTYLMGITGSYWLYRNGYRAEALFYGWVVQMQLIEFGLWLTLPCTPATATLSTTLNIMISRLGLLINHTEPMVLWYAIAKYNNTKNSSPLPRWVHGMMLAFVVATIWYSEIAWVDIRQCTSVSERSKPHLDWTWNREPFCRPYYLYFLACMAMLALNGLGGRNGRVQAAIMLTSYAASYYIYRDYNTVGEMWCFMAAFPPWFTGYLYKYTTTAVVH